MSELTDEQRAELAVAVKSYMRNGKMVKAYTRKGDEGGRSSGSPGAQKAKRLVSALSKDLATFQRLLIKIVAAKTPEQVEALANMLSTVSKRMATNFEAINDLPISAKTAVRERFLDRVAKILDAGTSIDPKVEAQFDMAGLEAIYGDDGITFRKKSKPKFKTQPEYD